MQDLTAYLAQRTYPGRGIVLGLSHDGQYGVAAYFIMGRSPNSRNRVFDQTSDGIAARALDENKVIDPSLILYNPVRMVDNTLIVTNGDQTDTVFDALRAGQSFEDALQTRTYEPDAPHYTSRISGVQQAADNKLAYTLSILRKPGENDTCERAFWHYENQQAGSAHIIHTYQANENPLPPFAGEPITLSLPKGGIDAVADAIWASLDQDNRISLYLRFSPIDGGAAQIRIINQYL